MDGDTRRWAEAGAEAVLTRNERDFTGSPLTPYRPEALLTMLRQ